MRAAIFRGPGELAIEEIERTAPGPGEIAVSVKAAATCGTDLKSYRRGHPKLFPELPARFGHEFAGIVTEVGAGVTKFQPGQRVVAANTAPCGSCWACTIGRESLCENLIFLNGAFAEELVIPAPIVERNTYVIPDSLPFEAAAPLEPLATVVHGIHEAGISLGDTVVVHGAGPIGLMFVRLATLRGATVVSVDQSAWRLEQALAAGASTTVDITGLDDAERLDAIRAQTPAAGLGADARHGASRCHRGVVRRNSEGRDRPRRLVARPLRRAHDEGRLPPRAALRRDRGGAAVDRPGRWDVADHRNQAPRSAGRQPRGHGRRARIEVRARPLTGPARSARTRGSACLSRAPTDAPR